MCIWGHKPVYCPIFGKKNRHTLCTRGHLDQHFFSSKILEISPKTGFLGPLWKILIPFKIIRLHLNFKSDITFSKLRILKISCPTACSSVKLSRGIHLGSRVRLPVFSFFVLFSLKGEKNYICRPCDLNSETSGFQFYARTARSYKRTYTHLDIKSICTELKKSKIKICLNNLVR
jgi:hypothetical protein